MLCFPDTTEIQTAQTGESRQRSGTEARLRVFNLQSQNPVLFHMAALVVVEAKNDAKNTAVFLALIENPLARSPCRNPDEGNERVGGKEGQGRKTQRRSGAQSAFVEPLFGKEWRNIWGHFNPSFSPKKKQLGKEFQPSFYLQIPGNLNG